MDQQRDKYALKKKRNRRPREDVDSARAARDTHRAELLLRSTGRVTQVQQDLDPWPELPAAPPHWSVSLSTARTQLALAMRRALERRQG